MDDRVASVAAYHLYLPTVMKSPRADIGAQIEGSVSSVVRWIVPGKAYQIPISWANFGAESQRYAEDVRLLNAVNSFLCLGVKNVPEEFRLWPEFAASPPGPDAYPALVEFLKKLISLYRPGRIELFNEPNVGRNAGRPYELLFGAWINDDVAPLDAMGAGKMYGEMLAAVYPAIKQHAPRVEIYAGALMRNEHMLDFIAGMGSQNADALSIHYYLKNVFNSPDSESSTLNAIRQHTALPLAISETSIRAASDSQDLLDQQANWLRWLLDNRNCLGLKSIMWYTLAGNGWDCTDLARGDNPTPAWENFRDA